ncbi:hypothetical protein [Pseudomonas putida]|nr:hypothetical protein [Pseudomonas putida]
MEAEERSLDYRLWLLGYMHYGVLNKTEYALAISAADKLYEKGKVSRDEYLDMIRLSDEALAGK